MPVSKGVKILWVLPSRQHGSLYDSYKKILGKQNIFIEFLYLREIFLSKDIEFCRKYLKEKADGFDIIFFTLFPDTIEIDRGLLEHLGRKHKLVLVSCDDEIYFSSFSYRLIPFFNYVLTTDKASIYYIKDQGVCAKFVPLQNLNYYDFSDMAGKDLDVCFIGVLDTDLREKYINYLTDNGVEVSVYGSGTKNGYLTEEKYWELLGRSKICLNFTGVKHNSYIRKNDPHRVFFKQAKGRPYEALAKGANVLSEKSSYLLDAIGDLDAVHFFSNPEEALVEIKKILNSFEEDGNKASTEILDKRFGIEFYVKLINEIHLSKFERVCSANIIIQ